MRRVSSGVAPARSPQCSARSALAVAQRCAGLGVLIGWLAAAGSAAADDAAAREAPLTGPSPAWVQAAPSGHEATAARSLPAAMLLNDMQVAFDASGWTEFHRTQFVVKAAEGLQALGAIPFQWSPWSDTLTFHSATIVRGAKRIDVLPKAGAFTVLRREAGLEQAMLTGELTAVLQPEGLQVGDVLEIEVSIRHADPVLKGHAAALMAGWDSSPVGRARLEATWPASLPVRWRETEGMPAPKRIEAGGQVRISVQLDDVVAAVLPAQAPVRFRHGRQLEITTFSDWSEISTLMVPLYDKAAELVPQSPLRAQIARIAAASPDLKARAAAVLQLVESQVRYLAHVEASGGYAPQTADETWRLRYGDCKAKTALLLALLKPLGVAAEPVLVNVGAGDAIADQLPSAGLFNHVLVRVRLDGRDYWLDGARQGDGPLDHLPVPAYGWGLPVTPAGARLMRIQPAAATEPMVRQVIRYDASGGVTAPEPTHLDTTFGGDAGLGLNLQFASVTPDRLQQVLRSYWASVHTAFTPTRMTAAWDPVRREEHLVADGTSKLDWSGAGLELQHVRLGGAPDVKRDPAASDPDAPFVTDYPSYTETDESVVLPSGKGASAATLTAAAVDRMIAGVAYRRTAAMNGGVLRVVASTRTLVPEITAAEARASIDPLTKLGETAVYAPAGGQQQVADDAAALDTQPSTASAYLERGNALLNASQFAEAEADFDAAIAIEPKLQIAWSDRAVARASQGDLRAASDADAADRLGKPEVVAAHARALLAERAGDLAGARAAYGRALALSPTDAFSLFRRADVEVRLNDYVAASHDIEAVAQADPARKQQVLYAQAEIEAAQHHDEAVVQLAAKLEVSTAETRLERARLYLQADKKAQALVDLDASIRLKPTSRAYLLRAQLGGVQTPAGKADLAAADALDPSGVDGAVRRINALTHAQDYPAALIAMTSLIKAHPDLGNLLVGRAEIEAKLGKVVEAQADFDTARISKGAEAANASVLCNGEVNAHAEAGAGLQDCTRAMRETPGEPSLAIDRAVLAHRLGLEAQASADIAAAGKLAGSDPEQLNNACYALATANIGLIEALALCDASLRIKPGNAHVIDSRGLVLLRLDRNADAANAYTQALRLDSKLADSLYGRAIAEKRLGRHADSMRDRTAALAINPHLRRSFDEAGVEGPD